VGQEGSLDLGRPHGARRDHHARLPQLALAGLDRAQKRPGKGIAHDHRDIGIVPRRQRKRFLRIEAARRAGDHRSAKGKRVDPHQEAGSVHKRRQGKQGAAGLAAKNCSHMRLDAGRRGHSGHGCACPQNRPQRALFPHHALGHSRRAAGVDEQQVVRAVIGLCRIGRAIGNGVEILRPCRGRSTHLKPQFHTAKARAKGFEDVGKLGIIDDDCAVGIVEDIGQFLAGVAVVDVHVNHPRLEGGPRRQEIGRRVAHQMRDPVARLCPGGAKRMGQRVGAAIEAGPVNHRFAVDQGRGFTKTAAQCRQNLSERIHGDSLCHLLPH